MDRIETLSPVRILVVDDHGVVRDALKILLESQLHMKVVGAAAGGRQAVLEAGRLRPDVVVMDLMLPDLSGADAAERIIKQLPQTRIVVLSACHTSEHVFRALRAGVRGYILKESAGTELVRAVRSVFAGERYFSPQITDVIVDGALGCGTQDSPIERLSAREREVLHLTAAGSTSAEIALRLSLSRKTVDTYRSRIMEKLGVSSRTELIHFAIEHAMAPA